MENHSSNNNNINNGSLVDDSDRDNDINNSSVVNDTDKEVADNNEVESQAVEVAVPDGNNNNAGQGAQPDGAMALPDEDIVMVNVERDKRSFANQITRAIELTEEQVWQSSNPRDWYRE